MTATIKTFSFLGIDVVDVNVQVKISPGLPNITIVGLPDKAVGESRERVRLAISSLGLNWPQKRITVNLAPADLQKEGSHFDLAIALGILLEMGEIKQESVNNFYALGELSLDGQISAVSGVISASIGANQRDCGIICPQKNGSEAAWAGDLEIIAAKDLSELIMHLNGTKKLERPQTKSLGVNQNYPDFSEVKGHESAKRALEIAAAGGHNLLMSGPPGTGKSMLASRLIGILPPPNLEEILEINMIHSISGKIIDGKLITNRPYRDPHHSCSVPAMVGGSSRAKPGEISLACNGILFLDELPEFPRQVLDSMRQPLETGEVSISRANSHITYPANFQLVGAMNPCRCGHLGDTAKQCKKAPICGQDYQNKISGPLLDRIDMIIEVPQIDVFFMKDKPRESSESIKNRVLKAREIQEIRYQNERMKYKINAKISGKTLEKHTELDDECQKILKKSVEKMATSMRGITRILRVARTIADLENSPKIKQIHLLEAIGYRRNI
jgi:magnesium chelatase family protein